MGEEKQWTKKYTTGGVNAIKKNEAKCRIRRGGILCMIIGTALTDSDIYWEMGVKGENESSRCLEEQAFQPEETARSKASRWTCLYLGVFGA